MCQGTKRRDYRFDCRRVRTAQWVLSQEEEWINHLGGVQVDPVVKGGEIHDRKQQKQDQQSRPQSARFQAPSLVMNWNARDLSRGLYEEAGRGACIVLCLLAAAVIILAFFR